MGNGFTVGLLEAEAVAIAVSVRRHEAIAKHGSENDRKAIRSIKRDPPAGSCQFI
jgi:hypothetical protein